MGALTTLLATKLFEPRVPRALVARPRLVQRLTDGLTARVTLLSAPAGYGKSTLLGEWRASPEGAAVRLAWVSVDEADDDPVRFWLHVAAALERASPGLAESLGEALLRPAPGPLRPWLEELVNRLAELSEPLVLVLDDLHAVASTEVFDSLAFLVGHLPPAVRLVVASRSDPPLPLASLRARGELSELRIPQLRFTRDEVRAHLGGNDIVLDGDSLGLLDERTEGWAAGVHLAALTLAGVEDSAGFVRRFAGDDRAVVDYLVDEVLARQPDAVQEFLLATSVLTRLSAPLCDAVTGGTGGAAMLRTLETQNLFLVALDNTRTWFRYHHMFADLLRGEMRARVPGIEHDLHQRAARWLSAEGLVVEAVPHAVAARDWELVIELGTTHGLALIDQGQIATFAGLFSALPDGELRARPEVSLGFAWLALMSSDLARVQGWLELADAALEETPGAPVSAVFDAELLWAWLHDRRGDVAGNQARVDRIVALLDAHPEVVGAERATRAGGAALYRGRAAVWDDRLAAADQHLAEALALYREHRPVRGVMEALGVRSLLAMWDGRVDDGRRDAEEALDLERDRGLEDTPHGAWAHLALGTGHLGRLELDDAEHHLVRSRRAFRAHHEPNCAALADAAWADWMRHTGRPHEAIRTVTTAHDERRGLPPFPPLVARWMARAEALARASVGDLDGAEVVADHGLPEIAARIAIERGDPERARRLADVALDALEGPGKVRERIEVRVTLAVAHAELGDRAASASALTDALLVAAPAEWLAPFVELGPRLCDLAAGLPPDQRPAVEGMRKRVLDGFSGYRPAEVVTQPGLVDKLSERELAVLRRLPSSLSTAEIAGLLYVSLNTVKTQVQSIYRKLGVNSRHEAVERARQLDLL
jgi:LuxR family transcriptional regulator, maltose regulon positive regulatory protein